MFERIKNYERYKDYYALNRFEVKASLIFSMVFEIIFFIFFEFYKNFSFYVDSVKDVILCIIAGNFGLLGMSLAGMAIITSLFTPEILRIINQIDRYDTVNRVLSSFEFSALNIILQIIYLIIIFFSLASEKTQISKIPFEIIFFLVVYHIFFNLLYILALIGNCIKLNNLKNSCETVKKIEKSLPDLANEVRIDYLLAITLKANKIDREEFIRVLDNMINSSDIREKKVLKEYLHNYYKS